MFFVLFFAIVVTGIVLLIVYSAKRARERRDALAAMAARLGLTFSANQMDADPAMQGQFSAFAQGRSRTAYNTMWGNTPLFAAPCPLILGDYSFETESGSGKDRKTTTHTFSYLVARLPFPDTPTLNVRKENFVDKIAGAIGFEDIDFESAEFSRMYYVSSADKKFAVDLIDPRMIEFLMLPNTPAFQLRGGRLLLGGSGGTWDVARFEATLAWLTQFADRWPAHVVHRLGGPQ